MRRRAVGAAVLGLLTLTLPALLAPGTAAAADIGINGGGSSFAAPEIQQWDGNTGRDPYNLSVNYTSNSSGAGRINYASGLYDFGASDVIYNVPEDGQSTVTEAEADHPFKYVTVSAGGLAFMYNLVDPNGTRVSNLQLTRNEVCQIFTGELTMWNNPELVATDPWLAGFDDAISPVTRSDSAGESYVLSQYCIAVDPHDWDTFITYTGAHAGTEPVPYDDPNMAAGQPVSYWPSQLVDGTNELQASGADNLADAVVDPATGKDSIGYMATAYARVRSFPVASVQNAANAYTQPTPTAVNLALSYAVPNSLGTFNLDFSGANPAAYFPSTYSYIVAPDHTESNFPLGKGQTLSAFLCYAIGLGQQSSITAPLAYAPLAQAVVKLSVAAIESIPGAPPAGQCGTGGPAPIIPPAPTTTVPAGSTQTTVPGGTTGTTAPPGTPATTVPAGATATTRPGATTTTPQPGGTTRPTASSGAAPSRGTRRSGAKRSPGGPTSTTVATAASPFGGEPSSAPRTAAATGQLTASRAPTIGSTSSSTTNFDTMWWLLLGGAICAIGTGSRRVIRKTGS